MDPSNLTFAGTFEPLHSLLCCPKDVASLSICNMLSVHARRPQAWVVWASHAGWKKEKMGRLRLMAGGKGNDESKGAAAYKQGASRASSNRGRNAGRRAAGQRQRNAMPLRQ